MSVELPTNESVTVDSPKLNLSYLSFHPPSLILTSDEHEGKGEGCEKNANAADGEHEDNDDGVDDAQSERLKCWELNCQGHNYWELNCRGHNYRELNCLGHIYREVNCQLP